MLLLGGGVALATAGPAAAHDEIVAASPEAGSSIGVGPSPTSTDTAGTAGHGEPSGGGMLLPILALVSGVIVLGGAVVIVLMVGRERSRRDRAAAESAVAAKTDEGADES